MAIQPCEKKQFSQTIEILGEVESKGPSHYKNRVPE
jgi:hypothetical protein